MVVELERAGRNVPKEKVAAMFVNPVPIPKKKVVGGDPKLNTLWREEGLEETLRKLNKLY